ncbi:hypothetical protein PybrP1_012697 [[Pythium] brassicae (nom. inval.)]|nr:hypothetical protein PybrP1_012697 [[Pythium] brassicae (nom. inval.)]
MDLASVWEQIARFQESYATTSNTLVPSPQEQALVRTFLQQVPVPALFACLQDASDRGDSKQVKQACSCIDRVLGADGSGERFFHPDMLPFVLAGLAHVERRARVLTVNQLATHLRRNPTPAQVAVVAVPEVIQQLCDAVADEDVEVAARAAGILETFAGFEQGEFFRPVLDLLRAKAQSSEITQNSTEFVRYLESIARICRQSDARVEYAISNGAAHVILNCLKSDDALFLLNVVDLIPSLSSTRVGIQHIFQSGTLQALLAMADDPFVGGSAIRLVGEMSATAAKLSVTSWNWSDPVLSKAFLETIERKIESAEPLEQIAAMDALAAFGSSSENELHLLVQHTRLCRAWLELGASSKLEVKANCFHALARVLGEPTRLTRAAERVPEAAAGVWALNERLFNSLGPLCRGQATVQFLMEILRQPFEEIRSAVFVLLRAVAAQNSGWGVRVLLSYGGLVEFLLDRATEPTKETREWKFAVADALVASPFHSMLDAVTLEKLEAHLRRGPYVGTAPASMDLDAA